MRFSVVQQFLNSFTTSTVPSGNRYEYTSKYDMISRVKIYQLYMCQSPT